ncbi:hypothetical protein [Myxococcus sp. AB025B]|uniref:IS66 family transposase n=1 Tax=Myxococcus sp. AB025B TaxID=2562794 RepID=UPI0011429D3E|nr:hypothetical protein [Myxococcus sp. AB025B]
MPRELPQDHFCPWREEAEELKAEVGRIGGEVDALKGQLAALQRHVFGRKAEKLPTVAAELRAAADATAARAEAAKKKRQQMLLSEVVDGERGRDERVGCREGMLQAVRSPAASRILARHAA